jgi:hypothetical protein
MKGGGEERSRRKKGGRSQDCGPVAVERGSVNCGGRGEEGTEGEGEGWESRARQEGRGKGSIQRLDTHVRGSCEWMNERRGSQWGNDYWKGGPHLRRGPRSPRQTWSCGS